MYFVQDKMKMQQVIYKKNENGYFDNPFDKIFTLNKLNATKLF